MKIDNDLTSRQILFELRIVTNKKLCQHVRGKGGRRAVVTGRPGWGFTKLLMQIFRNFGP